MRYKCECCGYYTLPKESSGTYGICPICYWEDDPVQLKDPDFAGGANVYSLNESRNNYLIYEVSNPKFIKYVRKPLIDELPESNNID